jgi:hypothetical protein
MERFLVAFVLTLNSTWAAELSLPLAKLMPSPESIELRRLADEYTLSLPIPERWQVKRAKLILDFIASNALSKRSQLRIQVNGVTVFQQRLEPNSARQVAVVSIPPALLVAGYNSLRFLVAQHYTEDRCEANDAPELWTQIDPVNSSVVLEYTETPPPLSLARLSEIFDPKLPHVEVALLFPERALSEQELLAGSLVAQGVALKARYAPFSFSLDQAALEGGSETVRLRLPKDQDAVLIGTRERLAPYFDPQLTARIVGPYLGLFANPKAPTRVLLVVSGRSDDEVRQAALAFALMRFPLPQAQETVIEQLDFAPFLPYQALPGVQPRASYTLAQLGFATASRQGLDPSPLEFAFYLPPDAFAPEDAQVTFLLHLAYNAGMRQDSLLEMQINGVFERAIQLSEVSGAHYRDYRIEVPLRSFRPGRNRISFKPLLVPAISGECTYFNLELLKVTLYEDSRLSLPAFSHLAQLPDLALLASSGFPYLDSGDGAGVSVYLLDRTPDTVLAAWQFLAQLARLNGLPLPSVKLGSAAPTEPSDWIVVGPKEKLASMPAEVAIKLQESLKTAFHPAGWEAAPKPWWWEVLSLSPAEPELSPRRITLKHPLGLGKLAAILALPHPQFSSKLVTALVSEDELYPAVRDLTRPELWSQMQGDRAFWQAGARILHWQAGEERFYRGTLHPSQRLIFHFARHPGQWLIAGLLVSLGLAWLLYRLLRRYKLRHHPDAQEVAP